MVSKEVEREETGNKKQKWMEGCDDLDFVLGGDVVVQQPVSDPLDGVSGLPHFGDLVPCAVGGAGVGHRVATVAVGLHLQDHGALKITTTIQKCYNIIYIIGSRRDACACACVCVRVSVCVCEREREREGWVSKPLTRRHTDREAAAEESYKYPFHRDTIGQHTE